MPDGAVAAPPHALTPTPHVAGTGRFVPRRAHVPLAGLALLLAYLCGSLLNDPRGFLGTDTGGKVATLEVLAERGGFDPDLGYWAEEQDPDGSLHPLYYTAHIGDRWVNVTTLPAVYVALPLYERWGYRGALLVPMAGAVAAAFAARALADRLRRGTGWCAFWVVGVGSPLAVYALDFWEHTIGVALMGWAAVALLDLVDRGGWWRAALAGMAFGAAATMRTEALVYATVAVGATCLALATHRRLAASFTAGAAALAGALLPLALNVALEVAVLDTTFRTGRATGTAAGAGADAASRLQEGLVTTFALHPQLSTRAWVLGVGLAVMLAVAGVRGRPGGVSVHAKVALGGAACLYLVRLAAGLGFVPGLVAATPLAVVGAALGWRTARGRLVVGVAVVALPLVWAFQFTGGAVPQWAGRYVLTSGFLLAVAGVAALPILLPWVRRALVALAVVVTAAGVGWLAQRSHDVADAHEQLAARPEPVLVSTIGHLAREGGAFYDGDVRRTGRPGDPPRWLTAPTPDHQREAAAVVARVGATSFGLVTGQGADVPAELGRFRRGATASVRFIGDVRLDITTYRLAGR